MKYKYLVLLIFVFLLFGCNKEEMDSKKTITLKIMHNGSNSSFMEEYGNLFNVKEEFIEFDVFSRVQTKKEASIDDVIKKYDPDVLLLSIDEYEHLVDTGKLTDLDYYIIHSSFDIENIMPKLINHLRGLGGGKLFGVPPKFTSQALFYNIDLFEQYNIDFPRDNMSWQEVLMTANGFAQNSEIVGLYTTYTPFQFIWKIAQTEDLKFVDVNQKKALINTDGWRDLVKMVVESYRLGGLAFVNKNNNVPLRYSGKDEKKIMLEGNLFLQGKSAMRIDNGILLNNLGTNKKINWDVVTVPVNPRNPNQTNTYSINDIYAISKTSQYPEEAWEVIKFINSGEMAKMKSRTTSFHFNTRPPYITEQHGKRLNAFYQLDPKAYKEPVPNEIADEFYKNVFTIGNEEINSLLNDEKDIDTVLNEMNEHIQLKLNQLIGE